MATGTQILLIICGTVIALCACGTVSNIFKGGKK